MSRFAITVVAALASGSWALILAHNGWVIPTTFFSPLSLVVTLLAGLLYAFDAWLWRWPLVCSLVGRPDLRGTWKGVIRSNAKTSNHNVNAEPIEVFVTIRQTFSTLHLRLLSPESQSFSLTSNLFEEAPEQFAVTWVFRNEPRLLVQDRSRAHLGGGLLRLTGEANSSMSGHYWTDRNTSGEIDLAFVARERANDYAAASKVKAPEAG